VSYLWYDQDGSFGNLQLEVTQDTFVRYLQKEQKTNGPELTLNLRMMYYTKDSVVLDHLTTSVEIKVKNDHLVDACA
jgi:hypothetical protein